MQIRNLITHEVCNYVRERRDAMLTWIDYAAIIIAIFIVTAMVNVALVLAGFN